MKKLVYFCNYQLNFNMKKILLFFLILNCIQICQSQSLKEEYQECTSQKYYNEDFRGAIVCLDKLIVLYPNDSSAYNNRGLIKEIIRDYSGAVADFTKEIEIDSTFADSYFF